MMKKLFKLALMGAIALTGTWGFTSCSSDEDVVETNPNYNAETQEVNADFVFNVATSNTPTSRMTPANTQATLDQAFRGINNAVLMSFIQKSGSPLTLDDGKSIAAATTANKLYNMGNIMGADEIDPDGTGTTPKSRRVIELTLPVESNTLMFWGKAIKTGTDNQQGSISWTVDKNLSNTAFTLNRRIPAGTGAGTEEAYKQYEKLIAAVLTKIVQTNAPYDVNYGGTQYTGSLKWSDYVTIDGTSIKPKTTSPADPSSDMCALGEILADAFVQLNTIYSGEVRAGSGPTVAKMLSDLYEAVHKVADASPTSKSEAITRAVASTIQTSITTVVDVSSTKWQALTTVKGFSGLNGTTETNLVTDLLDNFPKNFNVPNGAATLKFTFTKDGDNNIVDPTYDYNDDLPTYAMDGATGGSFNIFNYRYPAELCYFGNSPVRVTDDPHQTTEYPDGVTNWDNDASWAAGATGTGSKAWTKNGHVLSSTRSVAMQQNINYGTALLKTTVRYGASVLKDNNAAIQHDRKGATEADAEITAGAGTFTLTGILIGGVEETMGWNYVAKAKTGTDPKYFNSFIYDSDLPSTAIPAYTAGGAKSTPNYTLVWDNWNAANVGTKQNVVYVALEFVNNSGKDFWGMHNIIRNGATFYISGKLDPDEISATRLAALNDALPSGTTAYTDATYASDKSAGVTWPEKYALPPYDASGNTIKERRIFMQDYMTEANFVLGENSLKSALISVPDLRSTQISLGLSVDLVWQTGLSFDDIILGQ